MEIYNDTDKYKSLYHDTLSLLDIDEDDENVLTKETFIRYANEWYRRVATLIWESDTNWEWDDSGREDKRPIARTDLKDGQEQYTLPTDAFDIFRVEVQDSEGDFYRIYPFQEETIGTALSEWFEEKSMPRYYRLLGDMIFLKPAPSDDDVTLSRGLKMYVERDIKEFTPSDTDRKPGFPPNFHTVLSYGAALKYAQSKGLADKARIYKGEIKTMLEKVQNYYATRHRDYNKRLTPKINRKI